MQARNHHIDALRGAAILCVLLLHFALAYGLKNSPLSALPGWLLGAAYQGNYGVTIFFVISGYLITSTSLRRWGDLARIDLAAFYLYRIARLLPSLLLALCLIVLLGVLDVPFFANSDGGKDLPASYFVIAIASVLTFWHNVLMQSAGYFNYCLNVYWSLSVEKMFYLLLPLSCRFLRQRHWIMLLCGAAVVAGPVYRSLHADNEIYFMYGYLACFDAIAIGCLTALLTQHWQPGARAGQSLRWTAGLALAALYVRGIGGHEVFGFSAIALARAEQARCNGWDGTAMSCTCSTSSCSLPCAMSSTSRAWATRSACRGWRSSWLRPRWRQPSSPAACPNRRIWPCAAASGAPLLPRLHARGAALRWRLEKVSQVKSPHAGSAFQGDFQPELAIRTIMSAPRAAALAAIDGNNFVWTPVQ